MLSNVPISAEMFDAEACRRLWRNHFHQSGACCPECHTSADGRQVETWRYGGRVKCRSCGFKYTWRTGTPLANRSIDERQLTIMAALTFYKVPPIQIAAVVGVSIDTVKRVLSLPGVIH
jgi:transposase-like protein